MPASRPIKAGKHDGVIAFGGGSGLDVGKLIALMHGQTISVFDLEDVGDWWTRADASQDLADHRGADDGGHGLGSRPRRRRHPSRRRMRRRSSSIPAIMPKVALLDPELSVGLPAKLTAATGMDALAHCLEAYCAPFYHPLAKGVALEGMRLVKDNLAKAVKKGKDLDARGNMLVASSMGATAFQRGLGAIHALSHPFGGLYDAHHGLLNGIVMPYVLKANRRKIEKDIERAAAYLGIKGGFDGFLKWILALRQGDRHSAQARRYRHRHQAARRGGEDGDQGPVGRRQSDPVQREAVQSLARKCVTGSL